MTPEDQARQQIRRDRERRDRDGARKLGISVAQFRSLKANAVRSDTRRAAPAPQTPAPAKRFRGKVFQEYLIDPRTGRRYPR